jgi:hypothetical protein
MSGPEGGMSGPEEGMSGYDGGMSGPDYGTSGGMSGPDYGSSGGMSGPDYGNSGGMSGPDYGNSGGMSGPEDGMSGGQGPDDNMPEPDMEDIMDMFSCPYVVMISFTVVDGPETRFNGSFTLHNDTVSHTGMLMGNFMDSMPPMEEGPPMDEGPPMESEPPMDEGMDNHPMGEEESRPPMEGGPQSNMMDEEVSYDSSYSQKIADGEVILDVNTAIIFTCARSYNLDITVSGQDNFSVVVKFDFYDLSSIKDIENFSPTDSGYGYVNGSGTYTMTFSVNDDGTVSGMPRDGVLNTSEDEVKDDEDTAAFNGTTAAIAISSVVFVGIVFLIANFVWKSRNAVKPITVVGTTLVVGEKPEAGYAAPPGIQQNAGELGVYIPPASTS